MEEEGDQMLGELAGHDRATLVAVEAPVIAQVEPIITCFLSLLMV